MMTNIFLYILRDTFTQISVANAVKNPNLFNSNFCLHVALTELLFYAAVRPKLTLMLDSYSSREIPR